MLAGDLDGCIDDLRYPLLGSYKLDGVRAIVNGGRILSRKLKGIPNAFVRHQLRDPLLEGLDGELIVGDPGDDPIRRTVSGVMSYDGEPDFTYYVFDWMGDPFQPYELRLDLVHRLASRIGGRVAALPHFWIVNETELAEREEQALAMGYEGLMLRNPQGLYKSGRSTVREGYLLKLKRFADAEAVVIGVEEQMQNTNTLERDKLGYAKRSAKKAGMVGKNTLGALHVRAINGPHKGGEFSIGTGFDDELRRRIWDQHRSGQSVIGRIVKFKFFPGGSKGAPRFPVFLNFRDPRDMS
jgi:DNA ligase-1